MVSLLNQECWHQAIIENSLCNTITHTGACVYIIKINSVVVYVGRTKNLFLRLRTHNILPMIFTYKKEFSVITVEYCSVSNCSQYELINHFKPPLNRTWQLSHLGSKPFIDIDKIIKAL